MTETHKIKAFETSCEDSHVLALDALPPNVLPSDVLHPGLKVIFPDLPSPDVPTDIFSISLPDVSPVVPPGKVCTDTNLLSIKLRSYNELDYLKRFFQISRHSSFQQHGL